MGAVNGFLSGTFDGVPNANTASESTSRSHFWVEMEQCCRVLQGPMQTIARFPTFMQTSETQLLLDRAIVSCVRLADTIAKLSMDGLF